MRMHMFRASAWMAGSLAAFAILLALRIARVALPASLVVAAAALALIATSVWTGSILWSIRRGPRTPFDAARAIRCEGAEAERVRAAALRRDEEGGAGYVRRSALLARVALGIGLLGMLVSGLLNVALHVEGTWVQFADSGKDLDMRGTYRDVDAGMFADPAELRFGVLVGEVRPREPTRLLDVRVVNSSGETIQQETLPTGGAVRVSGMEIYPWSFGPGLHVTVLHKDAGRLFDDAVPLWPKGQAGRYAETIGGQGVELEIAASGWPWPEGVAGEVHARMIKGSTVLYDGALEPRKVTQGKEGYAVIAWELRPYVGLGVVHRTYRKLTLWSIALAVAAAAMAAWLRSRPFRYREEPDGAVLVSPASAWAALQRRRWP